MIEIFVIQAREGKLTIEDVPAHIRQEVQKRLDELATN